MQKVFNQKSRGGYHGQQDDSVKMGTTGAAIAHSGFAALNNYIGKPDIFGRKFKVQKANISDALAVSGVLIMGEGSEQTPLAVVEDVPFVKFQNRNPSKKELKEFHIVKGCKMEERQQIKNQRIYEVAIAVKNS